MTGAELVRKVRKLGRKRGVVVRVDMRRGKGSHGRLHYGDRFTTIKDRKKELSASLLADMLAQLELSKEDVLG